jgi:hypothetical protein
MFDDATISIPCPSCGEQTEQTIGWLKTHDHLACPACQKIITLEKEELLSGLKRAEKSLAEFQRRISKLGK